MTEPEDSIEVASPAAIHAVVEELVRRGNDPTLTMGDRMALEEPLLDAFVVSKEGKPFSTMGMTSLLMDYCHDRLGATLVVASPDQLRELLFTLLPRHTRFDADAAPTIVGETRAFFTYLKAHHGLAQAEACLEALGEGAEAELAAALSDRRNFGDDKVSAMNAMAGFGIPLSPLGAPRVPLSPEAARAKRNARKATNKARKKNR